MHANRYLEAVGRIVEGLSQCRDLDEAIRYTLATAADVVEADAGALLLPEEDTKELVFRYAVGRAGTVLLGRAIPWHEGLAGSVFATGKAEMVSSVEEDSRHIITIDEFTGYKTREMIVAPLKRWGGEPIGVLEIINKKHGTLTKEDCDILVVISALAAAVIEQMRATETLRQHENQLREVQKMEAIGRLAGGVAHDFNNLITVILGCADLCMPTADEGSKTYLKQIREASQQGAGLTRQLLTFTRRQPVLPMTVDIHTAIASVVPMLRQLMGEDIELVTALDDQPTSVKIDGGQLEQVIMNLAINARDAMPTGGRLTIQTSTLPMPTDASLGSGASDKVVLTVSDTGVGMDAVVQAHIFEPFYTTKPEGKGTGLGLSIVYGIVRQSGGTITVTSTVGQGTSFAVHLPISNTPGTSIAEQATTLHRRGTETLLLVEDESSVRNLAGEMLRQQGYRVVDARHGVEALELLKASDRFPDLIITDVVMPHLSGPEFVRRVRKSNPEAKVLYTSGYSDHPLLQDDVLDGIRFLQKPFTADILTATVRKVLDTQSPKLAQEHTNGS
jgi:two-component system cell cycle sensor histidine kinase/response regulator CckA